MSTEQRGLTGPLSLFSPDFTQHWAAQLIIMLRSELPQPQLTILLRTQTTNYKTNFTDQFATVYWFSSGVSHFQTCDGKVIRFRLSSNSFVERCFRNSRTWVLDCYTTIEKKFKVSFDHNYFVYIKDLSLEKKTNWLLFDICNCSFQVLNINELCDLTNFFL